ncbi:hypothetical protein C0993_003505, partial [Termitomyces sp. T159_Od127]
MDVIVFHDALRTESTTWAGHNPDRPIQPPRVQFSRSNTNSDPSMGTHRLLKKNSKSSLGAIREAVAEYLEDQKKFIDDLAREHLVDKERVKGMIINGSTYTST